MEVGINKLQLEVDYIEHGVDQNYVDGKYKADMRFYCHPDDAFKILGRDDLIRPETIAWLYDHNGFGMVRVPRRYLAKFWPETVGDVQEG